jgi:hypothetical protein
MEPHEKAIDESNHRFGKLSVACRAPSKHSKAYWICVCDCGKVREVCGTDLRNGKVTACAICSGQSLPIPGVELGFSGVIKRMKREATTRGLVWNIPYDYLRVLVKQNCFYCNSAPYPRRGKKYVYNGLDRVDNMLGYVPKNVVPCCWACNKLKGTEDVDTFFSQIRKIYHHSAKYFEPKIRHP